MDWEEALRHEVGPLLERQGDAPDGWVADIARYLDLVWDRNRFVNLVSRRSVKELVPRQVVPSLAGLRVIPAHEPTRVLDVGSGGGFPAIPLKILRPEARFALVDSRRKKCEFLLKVVAELDLEGVTVHWGRIQEPPETLREQGPFDVALARAVGAPREIAAAAAPFLRPGADLWVFADPEDAEASEVWRDRDNEPSTALLRTVPQP